ncbi:MAG: hypothetical protein ABSH00_03900 [Bryobacteraceae bacterium]
MNRKFWIVLNLALACAVVWATVELRDAWRAARAHQAATLGRRVAAPPMPPWQPLPNPPAVLPAAFKDVAQKDLLDRSRDPNVPIEPPPPPPPPPPVPPLPVYHGYMNLGGGPIAILSVTKASAHEAVRPGETIGEFTLRSVSTKEIEFAWGDQVIHKSVDELEDNASPAVQAAAARTELPPPALAPAPPPPAVQGPGEQTRFGVKLCNPGDTSPVGSVVDGYRKVMSPTPFGAACLWEPAQ